MSYVPGIDVSHWQNNPSTPQKMDFKKAVTAGARFVLIKVSERGGVDSDFLYHWAAAKEAGLPRGGYHFLRWDLSGLMQARIFCDLLKNDPGELPPVADFEAPAKDGLYPSNALLAQFLEAVEDALGIRPMIYTSPGFWNSYGKIKNTGRFDPKWAYYPLWIAHYFKTYTHGSTKPQEIEPWKSNGKTWTFWQWSAVGDGYQYGAESKGIDLNWFNGGEAQFQAYLSSLNSSMPPVQPPAPGAPPADGNPAAGQIDLINLDIEALKQRLARLEQWAGGFKS